MRFFRTCKYLMLLIPCLAVPSCREAAEEEEKVEVTVTGLPDDGVRFAAVPAGEVSFQIASTVRWSIRKTDLDWCTVTPMNDLSGQTEVTFKAVANDTDAPREGQITISAGDGAFSRSVRVFQEAGSTEPFAISGVDEGRILFDPDDAEPVSFTVFSGKEWTARTEGLDWCTVSPLEGGRNQQATLTLLPSPNKVEEERSGTILFLEGEEAIARVTVAQGAFVARISATPGSLYAAASGQMESSVVTVTANAAWTASAGADWITVEPASGEEGVTQVTVTVGAHEGFEDRQAEISFVNLSATAAVTVNQAARIEDRLEVDPGSIEFPAMPEGVTQTVAVTSNTIWSVSTDASWLTVSPLRGNGDGSLTLSAAENEDPLAREAVVTIQAGTVTRTVTVTQLKGLDPADFADLLTGTVNWTAGADWDGYRLPSASHPGIAWAEWTWNNGPESVDYPEGYPTADVNKSMNRVRCVWKDDALVFRVPVFLLPAGRTLALDFAWRGGSKLPACWTVEACLDGTTWVPMKITGETEGSVDAPYTDKDGAARIAPLRVTKKDSAHPFEATLTVPKEMKGAQVAIRVRAIDILEVNGTVYADVPTSNSNCHLYIPKFTFGGVSYAGPQLSLR